MQQATTRTGNQRAYQSTTIIPGSSFRLQQLLFFEYYYQIIYIFLTASCITFKSEFLPYTSIFYLRLETAMQICLYILTFSKIKIGNIGNKSENSEAIQKFLVVSVGTIVGHVFFLRYQTFVLQLEFIGSLIGLVFASIGLILGFFAFLSFKVSERSMYN